MESYTNTGLYEAIFKRKSFHLFRGVGEDRLVQSELGAIVAAWKGFKRLLPEIRTAIRIVPAMEVNFKRDAEYCILIYSEKKENYLMNAGYIGEQLDLWLVSHNIGSLWFGDDLGIADIARFAPSACNTQPWYVENKDGILTVFRYRKPGKRGIMPAASVSYYNRIDIGIYLCILEVCMLENGARFERDVFPDAGGEDEYSKVAVYKLM